MDRSVSAAVLRQRQPPVSPRGQPHSARRRASAYSAPRRRGSAASIAASSAGGRRRKKLSSCFTQRGTYDNLTVAAVEKGVTIVDSLPTGVALAAQTVLVSGNSITSLDGIQQFGCLRVLSAGGNLLESLRSIAAVGRLPALEILSLSGNKVTRTPHYRAHVISACKKLHTLDSVRVTDRERTASDTDSKRGHRYLEILRAGEDAVNAFGQAPPAVALEDLCAVLLSARRLSDAEAEENVGRTVRSVLADRLAAGRGGVTTSAEWDNVCIAAVAKQDAAIAECLRQRGLGEDQVPSARGVFDGHHSAGAPTVRLVRPPPIRVPRSDSAHSSPSRRDWSRSRARSRRHSAPPAMEQRTGSIRSVRRRAASLSMASTARAPPLTPSRRTKASSRAGSSPPPKQVSPCARMHTRSQYGDCPIDPSFIEWRHTLRVHKHDELRRLGGLRRTDEPGATPLPTVPMGPSQSPAAPPQMELQEAAPAAGGGLAGELDLSVCGPDEAFDPEGPADGLRTVPVAGRTRPVVGFPEDIPAGLPGVAEETPAGLPSVPDASAGFAADGTVSTQGASTPSLAAPSGVAHLQALNAQLQSRIAELVQATAASAATARERRVRCQQARKRESDCRQLLAHARDAAASAARPCSQPVQRSEADRRAAEELERVRREVRLQAGRRAALSLKAQSASAERAQRSEAMLELRMAAAELPPAPSRRPFATVAPLVARAAYIGSRCDAGTMRRAVRRWRWEAARSRFQRRCAAAVRPAAASMLRRWRSATARRRFAAAGEERRRDAARAVAFRKLQEHRRRRADWRRYRQQQPPEVGSDAGVWREQVGGGGGGGCRRRERGGSSDDEQPQQPLRRGSIACLRKAVRAASLLSNRSRWAAAAAALRRTRNVGTRALRVWAAAARSERRARAAALTRCWRAWAAACGTPAPAADLRRHAAIRHLRLRFRQWRAAGERRWLLRLLARAQPHPAAAAFRTWLVWTLRAASRRGCAAADADVAAAAEKEAGAAAALRSRQADLARLLSAAAAELQQAAADAARSGTRAAEAEAGRDRARAALRAAEADLGGAEAAAAAADEEAIVLRKLLAERQAALAEHEAGRSVSERSAAHRIEALEAELKAGEVAARAAAAEIAQSQDALSSSRKTAHQTIRAWTELTAQLRRSAQMQSEQIAGMERECERDRDHLTRQMGALKDAQRIAASVRRRREAAAEQRAEAVATLQQQLHRVEGMVVEAKMAARATEQDAVTLRTALEMADVRTDARTYAAFNSVYPPYSESANGPFAEKHRAILSPKRSRPPARF